MAQLILASSSHFIKKTIMLRYIYTAVLFFGLYALSAQTYTLAGQIETLYDNTAGNVVVSLLDENNVELESQTTACDGSYSFSNLAEGQNYQVQLSKNENSYNGISTLDMVLHMRYLLGIIDLDNAYNQRAADVDDSGNASVMDLVILRGRILAIFPEFQQTDWLFFQQDAGTEGIVFPITLFSDQTAYNFLTVKRGDLNGSADPCE